MIRARSFVIGLLYILFSIHLLGQDSKPIIEREFRAAWIATVANINWPSSPYLSEEEQKKEAIKLLDLLKKAHYNAVIFQVRPQADAIYKSDLEPWSYYLTGQQGVAPDDFYDPLDFWVNEAHKRGLELHAWINPYRAHHKSGKEISEYSIVSKKPELVLKLEEGYWWFDPSLEETQDHSYTVVMDIARRYDIDGIHFDDYFYPYPSYNGNKDFPDSVSWHAYEASGGKLSKSDWRRDNVNKFIERIYKHLKLMKPHVKFGLSPFGIWRPNNPESIKGFDQYDQLYADAKLWLNKGWIDYFTPQLYWTVNDVDQSFPVLLGWWQSENYKKRHLWPGSNISRGSDEMLNQIMITRGMLPNSCGNVHWSIAPIVKDSTMVEELLKGPYKRQAAVPKSSWLWHKNPDTISANIEKLEEKIIITPIIKSTYKTQQWVIYFKYGNKWEYSINSIFDEPFCLDLARINQNEDFSLPLEQVGISVIDRFGNESETNFIDFK